MFNVQNIISYFERKVRQDRKTLRFNFRCCVCFFNFVFTKKRKSRNKNYFKDL